MKKIYQSLATGTLMTPVKETHNGIMFYECDAKGEIIYAPRAWNNNATPCRQTFYVSNPIDNILIELTPAQLELLQNAAGLQDKETLLNL